MRFLFRLDLSLHAGAGKKNWNLEVCNQTRACLNETQIFFPSLAWRLKSRLNKKRIATVVCKWRDESNEPN